MLHRLRTYFKSGDSLTAIVRKNIVQTLLIKASGMVLNLAFVPLTLSLLSTELYGVWLTLNSIVAWFLFIDFGLGNGLRNKVTQLLAQGEQTEARIYVSTLYAATGIIALVFCGLYASVHPFINWAQVLRVSTHWQAEVSTLALVAFISFGLQLLLRNITFVLLAVHKSSMNALFPFMSNLLTLILLVTFRPWLQGSLLHVGLALLIPQLVVLAAFHLYFFREKGLLHYLRPTLTKANRQTLREFGGLGLSFFVVQLAWTVIFASTNLLITRLLGPVFVAQYDVTYRYFGQLPMVFSIVISPLWSAFGHAYHTNDITWIDRTLTRMRQLWLVFMAGQVGLIGLVPILIPLWVGKSIEVSTPLAIAMTIYYGFYMFGSIYTNMLNGVSEIRNQVVASTVAALLLVPFAYLFTNWFNMGLIGVIAAVTLCSVYSAVIAPMEVRRLLRKMNPQTQEKMILAEQADA